MSGSSLYFSWGNWTAVQSVLADKPDIAVGNVFGIPSSFQLLQNYGEVFAKTDALKYLINTLLIAVPTMLVSVALACLTA